MKSPLATYGVAAVIVFGIMSVGLTRAAQNQSAPAAKSGPGSKTTPRTPDGRPDLSGFYNLVDIYKGDPVEEKPGQHVVTKSPDGSIFFNYGGANSGEGGAGIRQTQNGAVNLVDRTCASCENPPYKPEYMAKAKAIGDAMHGDASPLDPQYDCKPYGVPRGSLRGAGGYGMQIVQNHDVVAFLYEDRPGPYFRIVYLDGRGHPEDLDKSYYGHSIGHWEGDTLVVDVVGLNDETWLGSGTVGPKLAMMHSDQLHVIERWTRAGDTLTWEATVEDPVMFTKPWVMTPRQTQIGAPDDYIRPSMCLALDKSHLVKSDNTFYNAPKSSGKPAVAAAAAQPAARIVGNWNVQIHSTIAGILNQQWMLKQEGAKITGTVKTATGELPLAGTLDGGYLRATVNDGDKTHVVRATIIGDGMDGTIKMGRNEFRLSAKRTQ
jgi:hypothetical protein